MHDLSALDQPDNQSTATAEDQVDDCVEQAAARDAVRRLQPGNVHSKHDRHLSQRHVTLRNDLVAAALGLKTLAEQRVVKSCAAKLDSVRLDQGRYRITLAANEYAETFGLDPNTAYEQLKEVANSLLERVIRREEQTKRGLKVHKDHWVSGITYHEGEAWLELRFSHEATPYLTMLRGNHTTYLLKQAARLRSVYSWRLLEMLMQYKDTGWKQVSVEAFATAMDAKTSHTTNFKDLRRWIIEPAVKELTEKDGWLISWRAIKAGRKAPPCASSSNAIRRHVWSFDTCGQRPPFLPFELWISPGYSPPRSASLPFRPAPLPIPPRRSLLGLGFSVYKRI